MRRRWGISALAIGAALLCSPVGAAPLNLGGNGGGLLGTGLLAGNSNDGSNNTSASVSVNGGNNGGLLNLGGGNGLNLGDDGSQAANATLNLGDRTQGNVLLDLFGNGGDTGNAQVTLGMGGLDSGDNGAGAGDVRMDLFGDGSSNGSPGILDESGGGGGAKGLNPGVSVASLETRAATGGCFSPNANQLTKLASRHDYVPSTFATWNSAAVVKVIDVGLCSASASTIAAQPNIGRLHNYVGGNATLRAQLAQWGHKPGELIAADRQGKTLIFYVG
jgi:hypothetical protein